jgi:hypothetical protein
MSLDHHSRCTSQDHGEQNSMKTWLDMFLTLVCKNFGMQNSITLTEKIPSWMGLLSKLQNLPLNNINFTGGIPTSLSNISLLEIINLEYNKLSGSIPSS